MANSIYTLVTIFTIMFMTITRYYIIKKPFNSLAKSTSVTVGKWHSNSAAEHLLIFDLIISGCIVITWLYSIFCIVLTLHSDDGYMLEGLLINCTFNYLNKSVFNRFLVMVMMIGSLVIPFFIIIVYYQMLYFEIQVSRSKLKQFNLGNTRNSQKKPSFKRNKTNSRLITRIVLTITFVCIVSLPDSMQILIAQYDPPNKRSYVTPLNSLVAMLLTKMSSLLSPIVFILINKKCRKYFKDILFNQTDEAPKFITVTRTKTELNFSILWIIFKQKSSNS